MQNLKNLWEQREALVSKLNAEGVTDDAERRITSELDALDAKIQKAMGEVEREQRSSEAFKRYSKLTGNDAQFSEYDKRAVDWLKSAVLLLFSLKPKRLRVRMHSLVTMPEPFWSTFGRCVMG
jgi:hypothetical protein